MLTIITLDKERQALELILMDQNSILNGYLFLK